MEKFLKYLKTESIGGHIIRFALAGLLLFGGFAKLALVGEINYPIVGAILLASIETLSAIGLLYHFKIPVLGILGGFLAIFCILIRLIFSLFWMKTEMVGIESIWGAFHEVLSVFNNGLFFIMLLLGAAVYCMGNSYKAYFRQRITQPWPR